MNYEQLTEIYLKMREACSALTKEYDAKIAAIKTDMAKVEGVLLNALLDAKVNSMNTNFATFYIEETIKPSAHDWDAFYNWVQATGNFEALEKRLTKTFIAGYMATNKDVHGHPMLPPGVAVLRENVVRVRRNKDK